MPANQEHLAAACAAGDAALLLLLAWLFCNVCVCVCGCTHTVCTSSMSARLGQRDVSRAQHRALRGAPASSPPSMPCTSCCSRCAALTNCCASSNSELAYTSSLQAVQTCDGWLRWAWRIHSRELPPTSSRQAAGTLWLQNAHNHDTESSTIRLFNDHVQPPAAVQLIEQPALDHAAGLRPAE